MLNKKKVEDSQGHFYQAVIFYNKQIKVGFHHESLTYPFYAPIVFDQPAKATKFLSQFVKDMVAAGDLPSDAIKDGEVNEEIVKCAVQDLILADIELADEDE